MSKKINNNSILASNIQSAQSASISLLHWLICLLISFYRCASSTTSVFPHNVVIEVMYHFTFTSKVSHILDFAEFQDCGGISYIPPSPAFPGDH